MATRGYVTSRPMLGASVVPRSQKNVLAAAAMPGLRPSPSSTSPREQHGVRNGEVRRAGFVRYSDSAASASLSATRPHTTVSAVTPVPTVDPRGRAPAKPGERGALPGRMGERSHRGSPPPTAPMAVLDGSPGSGVSSGSGGTNRSDGSDLRRRRSVVEATSPPESVTPTRSILRVGSDASLGSASESPGSSRGAGGGKKRVRFEMQGVGDVSDTESADEEDEENAVTGDSGADSNRRRNLLSTMNDAAPLAAAAAAANAAAAAQQLEQELAADGQLGRGSSPGRVRLVSARHHRFQSFFDKNARGRGRRAAQLLPRAGRGLPRTPSMVVPPASDDLKRPPHNQRQPERIGDLNGAENDTQGRNEEIGSPDNVSGVENGSVVGPITANNPPPRRRGLFGLLLSRRDSLQSVSSRGSSDSSLKQVTSIGDDGGGSPLVSSHDSDAGTLAAAALAAASAVVGSSPPGSARRRGRGSRVARAARAAAERDREEAKTQHDANPGDPVADESAVADLATDDDPGLWGPASAADSPARSAAEDRLSTGSGSTHPEDAVTEVHVGSPSPSGGSLFESPAASVEAADVEDTPSRAITRPNTTPVSRDRTPVRTPGVSPGRSPGRSPLREPVLSASSGGIGGLSARRARHPMQPRPRMRRGPPLVRRVTRTPLLGEKDNTGEDTVRTQGAAVAEGDDDADDLAADATSSAAVATPIAREVIASIGDRSTPRDMTHTKQAGGSSATPGTDETGRNSGAETSKEDTERSVETTTARARAARAPAASAPKRASKRSKVVSAPGKGSSAREVVGDPASGADSAADTPTPRKPRARKRLQQLQSPAENDTPVVKQGGPVSKGQAARRRRSARGRTTSKNVARKRGRGAETRSSSPSAAPPARKRAPVETGTVAATDRAVREAAPVGVARRRSSRAAADPARRAAYEKRNAFLGCFPGRDEHIALV